MKEGQREKPKSPAPTPNSGTIDTDWRKVVFRVLIAKMKKESENNGHKITNKDRVEFQLYLDGSSAIVEDVSEPYDPGFNHFKEFNNINDLIKWMEV